MSSNRKNAGEVPGIFSMTSRVKVNISCLQITQRSVARTRRKLTQPVLCSLYHIRLQNNLKNNIRGQHSAQVVPERNISRDCMSWNY